MDDGHAPPSIDRLSAAIPHEDDPACRPHSRRAGEGLRGADDGHRPGELVVDKRRPHRRVRCHSLHVRRRFSSADEQTRLDPPKRVEWRCVGGHANWQDNTFSFALNERKGETLVQFVQEYAQELSDEAYGIYNFNWGYYLNSLKMLCEKGRALRSIRPPDAIVMSRDRHGHARDDAAPAEVRRRAASASKSRQAARWSDSSFSMDNTIAASSEPNARISATTAANSRPQTGSRR